MPKKGTKFTAEHKANIAAARRGTHHSDETKKKISNSLNQPEMIKRLHDANRLKYLPQHVLESISAVHRGAKLTDEHKLHLSQGSSHGYIKLSIDGKQYNSIAEASRELGIRYHVFVRIVKFNPEELEEFGHHLDWIKQQGE